MNYFAINFFNKYFLQKNLSNDKKCTGWDNPVNTVYCHRL